MSEENIVTPEAEQPLQPSRKLIFLAAFFAATLVLYLISLRFVLAGDIELFLYISIIAWPVWAYQKEAVLFERRVILERVVVSDSWIRRWFWAGSLTQVFLVFKSLLWSFLLLAQVSLLRASDWFVIAIDLLILSLLIDLVRSKISSHIQTDHQGIVMRRWPLLLLNLTILTTLFLLVDFIVGAPDTRSLSWDEVAQHAFNEYYQPSGNILSGSITGFFSMVDSLSWHLAESLIPQISSSLAKWISWAIFLLTSGFGAYLFTQFLLGVGSVIDLRLNGKFDYKGISSFSIAFIYTILFLSIPYIWLATLAVNWNPSTTAHKISESVNPCKTDQELVNNLRTKMSGAVDAEAQKTLALANSQVDAMLDKIFPDVEKGVDAYLDWYFSVIGEYERLGTAAGMDFGDRLTENLLENTGFNENLKYGGLQIDALISERMTAVVQRLGQNALTEIRQKPCEYNLHLSNIQALNSDSAITHIKIATGASAGTAIVASKLIAKNIGAKVGAKVAAKMAAKKLVAKGTASVLTAGLGGLACGPFAIVCGITAGVVTWIATDVAMVEIDEHRLRPQMRLEMMEWIQAERLELATAMKLQNESNLKIMTHDIGKQFEAFVPYRDGL